MPDRIASIPAGGARLKILLLLVLLGLGLACWLAWRDFQRFADTPLALQEAELIDFPRGASFSSIVDELRSRQFSNEPRVYWKLLSRQMQIASRLQAGEYRLEPGTTPRQLMSMLAQGKVVQHHFTIVEGWTFRQLRLALAKEAGLKQELPGLDAATVAHRLGIETDNPEGWFLPETYAWVRGDSDLGVLRHAHEAMQRALEQRWPGRDPGVPVKSIYEALILASIVEKETGVDSERAQIAGVFARRMQIGMRLQTDPSVVYGLGETYDGNIRRRDLDTDTPYNTYTRGGLPPTPIALPGLAAIDAVLHPAAGNALYFVALGDGSGRHEFSNSLDEHNRAVRRYLIRRKQQ